MSKSSFYLYLILGLLWKSNDVLGDIYKETQWSVHKYFPETVRFKL